MLQLPTFNDPRGSLTVLERALPFAIVRTYWIYGSDGQTRGGHRHTHTRQALIALSGEVSMYMYDGITEETIVLNHPSQCLLVEPKDWHTMTFGKNAVLLVMSSHPYDRSEYIDTPYERASHD
jgi:dTDP-4-dehydrorhamnose 3,5-epimerase-like enzyme